MIPISDSNPHNTTIFTCYTIAVICTLVLLYQITLSPEEAQAFFEKYAVIPNMMDDPSQLYRLLTSLFLHAHLFHLIGNMVFLFIFADNIEHAFGHLRFIIFYLLSGMVSAFSMAIGDMTSTIPAFGASGAIMACCGAYLALFPRAEVTMFLIGFRYQTITFQIKAYLIILYWVFLDLYGFFMVDTSRGGIGYEAHLSGFLVGICFGRILKLYDSDYDGYITEKGVWVRHKLRSQKSDMLEYIESVERMEKANKAKRRPVNLSKSEGNGFDRFDR